MNALWLPEQMPPTVSTDARREVMKRVATAGLHDVVGAGYSQLVTRHKPLRDYLLILGNELNRLYEEGPWPQVAIKVGSSLAILAYAETGFMQPVDETAIKVGQFAASIADGVPNTFSSSVSYDQELGEIIEETIDLDFSFDTGDIRQVIEIGAGCTRHFMQQAIAA